MLNKLRTKKRGFTLLELIVVIVILGVIAGLAVPTFLSVTTKSRQQVALNEANAFARDVKALAAFTTGADASAWTAEADGETAGSYANGTYTASNGCTVAVTTSGDDVTVGAVSCDGAAAPTTTTPAASSCAQGGTCAVGDIGPAGGVIVLSAATSGDGKNYEVAPADLEMTAWCPAAAGTNISGASGTGVGTGAQNTTDMVAVCTQGAGYAAANATVNGYSDWFLPSKDELGAIYAMRALVPGLGSGEYLSSSEVDEYYVWHITMGTGAWNGTGKTVVDSVRIIRSF